MTMAQKGNLNPVNYLGSRELSEKLAFDIKEFYRSHPAYPKWFCDEIKMHIYKNPSTGDFYIRSNLGELMTNIVDLEEKYGL
jgi:hypothetical protein